MERKVIQSEKKYQAALARLEQIFDSTKESRTTDELEILSLLIEKYEQESSPIDLPDSTEAIKFRKEQIGLK
jgi:HTH-type transcriptional regulator/antitoxin HigA